MKPIKSYEYNGTNYEYALTLKAKTEIEKLETNKSKAFFDKDKKEELKSIGRLMSIKTEIDKAKQNGDIELEKQLNEEMMSLSLEVAPLMNEMELGGNTDEMKEIMYILLKSHKNYRDKITRELHDEIIEDMEYAKGLEETWAFMVEVKDSVFTQIEQMNKALDK